MKTTRRPKRVLYEQLLNDNINWAFMSSKYNSY